MKKERLTILIERENTHTINNKRKAIFTIFAGNDELLAMKAINLRFNRV